MEKKEEEKIGTMVQNNQGLLARLFTSLRCVPLRYAALTGQLDHSLPSSLDSNASCWDIRLFWTIVNGKKGDQSGGEKKMDSKTTTTINRPKIHKYPPTI